MIAINQKLKELIEIPESEVSQKYDELLFEELKNVQLLIHVEINSKNTKKLDFKLLTLKNKYNKIVLGLYTDIKEIQKSEIKSPIISIYTSALSDMLKNDSQNISNIVINPFSEKYIEINLNSFLKLFEK